MATHVEAVFENGVFRPLQPLSLAEQEHVLLTVSPIDEENREESLASIRRGLAEAEAGLLEPFDAFDCRFREEHGLPPRS